MEEDEELAIYDKVWNVQKLIAATLGDDLEIMWSQQPRRSAQPPSFLVLQGFTDDQMMLVEQNTVMVEEREREIRQIVQSISDLNEIFRDLAGMVVEQVSHL